MKFNAIISAVLGLTLFPLGQLVHAEGGSITLEARCDVRVKDSNQFGDRSVAYNEQFCGITNVTGAGFMHRVSLFGVVWSEASASDRNLFGQNVIVDEDRDEIYMSIERRGVAPDPGVGRWTIIGGTGKYAGASGSGTYEVTYLPSVVEDVFLNLTTLKGRYQIP